MDFKFKEELISTLKKKAFGFGYTEESLEYETKKPKKYVFCEKRNRIYFENGFIKVRPVLKAGEIVEVMAKPMIFLKRANEMSVAQNMIFSKGENNILRSAK